MLAFNTINVHAQVPLAPHLRMTRIEGDQDQHEAEEEVLNVDTSTWRTHGGDHREADSEDEAELLRAHMAMMGL